MGALFSYSLASAIVLTILYLVYKVLLSSERQPVMNRIIIGIIYAVAITVPLLDPFLSELMKPASSAEITIGAPIAIAMGDVTEPAAYHFPWMSLLLITYGTGVAVTLSYLVFSIIQLSNIIRKCEIVEYNGNTIAVSSDNRLAPFSWLGYIVMSRSDFEKEHESIIAHEAAHIAGMHCIDIILSQVVACFQWFNPAAWLMTEELRTVHEYEADDAVISSGADIRQYQLLLIKKAVGTRFPSPANSLNQSKIKKRITMMYKSRPTSARRLRALTLVPAIAAGLFIIGTPAVAAVLSETSETALIQKSDSKVTKNSAESNDDSLPRSYATWSEIESPVADQAKAANADGHVYDKVEKEAEFPGGEAAYMKFLMENVRYPKDAQQAKQQGRVVVKFVVTKDGKITNPVILRSVSKSLDNEAMRVIKGMPDWKPAEVKGKKVDSWYTVPITFGLK